MNYLVHSLMYTYYAFRALKFRIPKWTMMTITALQLLQMVVGCGLTVFTYKVDPPCLSAQLKVVLMLMSIIYRFTRITR